MDDLTMLTDILNKEGFLVAEGNTEKIRKILTEKFIGEYEKCTDMEDAFRTLNSQYNGLIEKLFLYDCGDWTIGEGANFYDDMFDEYNESFSSLYFEKAKDKEELFLKLESKVMDAMCNCGVDCITALESILNDMALSIDDDEFILNGLNENPELIWQTSDITFIEKNEE